jgi:hypothetical protein
MRKNKNEPIHTVRIMNRLETMTVVNEDHPYKGPTGSLFIRDEAPDPMNFTGKRKDKRDE